MLLNGSPLNHYRRGLFIYSGHSQKCSTSLLRFDIVEEGAGAVSKDTLLGTCVLSLLNRLDNRCTCLYCLQVYLP